MSDPATRPLFPSFKQVAEALSALSSLGTAAESHGLISAFLCFNLQIHESAWVDSLLSSHIEAHDEEGRAAYRILTQLFQGTQRILRDDPLSFSILLPTDETPMAERLHALREWCQGFLIGLNLIGIKLNQAQDSADLQEAVDDLLAISEVELTAADETDPEAEEHFLSLLEHVKAAVLLIQAELKNHLFHRDASAIH